MNSVTGVCNDKNRSGLLREDCQRGEYNSVYHKHDGRCLLAATAGLLLLLPGGRGPGGCRVGAGLLQLPPPAGALGLSEVPQRFCSPGWVWVAEAFAAGALPSLSFVTGPRSACVRGDSAAAKHVLKREFVSEVSMWIAVL